MSGRNRGPAAAATNRAAIIAAARELFASDGYEVPLSRVAEHAGVGRASLYRHFESRQALAWAVFTDNIETLTDIARGPDAQTFDRLWSQLVTSIVESRSLFSFMADLASAPDAPQFDLEAILAGPLRLAQEEGRFAGLSPSDITIILRMLWGLLALSTPEHRQAEAKRALSMIDPDLARGIG